MKIALIDIDGTVADHRHRLHYIENSPKNWSSFYDECDKDKPYNRIIAFVKKLSKTHKIIFLTGRKEIIRDKTLTWIKKYLPFISQPKIIMRPDEDFDKDYEYKVKAAKQLKNVVLVVDDLDSIINAFKKEGIETKKVNHGNFV